MDCRGDRQLPGRICVALDSGELAFEAVAEAVDGDDVAVVEEPVEDGGGQDLVTDTQPPKIWSTATHRSQVKASGVACPRQRWNCTISIDGLEPTRGAATSVAHPDSGLLWHSAMSSQKESMFTGVLCQAALTMPGTREVLVEDEDDLTKRTQVSQSGADVGGRADYAVITSRSQLPRRQVITA